MSIRLKTQPTKRDLLPLSVAKRIPKLYATEHVKYEEKTAQVKLFDPVGSWTWYIIEYDPESELCFGLVEGFETELGYFYLQELVTAKKEQKGIRALPIERDRYFRPTKLKDI